MPRKTRLMTVERYLSMRSREFTHCLLFFVAVCPLTIAAKLYTSLGHAPDKVMAVLVLTWIVGIAVAICSAAVMVSIVKESPEDVKKAVNEINAQRIATWRP